ncbi:MAG: DUF362 domain-containing protein [Methanomicrobiales archaeon]|nr:DUF362 domain-containing protein [Methanomicrobiales archaeon]
MQRSERVNHNILEKDVGVAKCGDYSRERVRTALERSIRSLGIPHLPFKPGEKVFLKPNMLLGTPPERGITTHPEVVRATAELLLERGCRVTLGDSPGGGVPFTERSLRSAYIAAGYAEIADELGIELCCDTSSKPIAYPEGNLAKHFTILNAVLEADAVVVVSKLKTHMWMRMTGAAKNIFGVVPGLEKPALHFRFQTDEAFAGMLIDLNSLVRSAFHVMDAVNGMEGDGPTSGRARRIGAILASRNPYALDVVAARLISMDPSEVPLLRKAAEWGLLETDCHDVTVVGDPIDDLIVKDFKKPSSAGGGARGRFMLSATRFFGRAYAEQPVIRRERCMGCGRCAMNCPAGAIEVKFGKARIQNARCIRCYCCHEMCLEHAIVLRRGIAGALMGRILG